MRKGTLIVLCVLAPAGARAGADGCFVWRKGVDINEPSQKAIILHHAGREDLILQVKYSGPVAEFGWLVPVPGKPAVEKADMKCFYELSRYFQAANRYGRRKAGGGVTVIERKTVGAYDVAVLSATDPGALTGWLTKNRFNWPKDRQDVLDHYVRKKWFFVAVRINLARADDDTAERLRTGELHPLKISFDTPRCVYPLKISSVNRGGTEVHVYVIAAGPLVCPRMDFFSETPPRLMKEARPGAGFRACEKALPRMKGKSWFVLKHAAMFFPETMQDLVFQPLTPANLPALQAEFLRSYCTGRDGPMSREIRHIEAELGRLTAHGGPAEQAAVLHRRLGLIRNRLKVLAGVAPKVFVPLAVALLEQGRGSLLTGVKLADVKAPVDGIVAAATERLGQDGDRRMQEACWRILISAGARAAPGVKILRAALAEGEADALVAQPGWFGLMLKGCPDEELIKLLAAMLNVTDRKQHRRMQLARAAGIALAVAGDRRAVPLLIAHLNGPAGLYAARTLAELKDPRAIEPLAKAPISSAVLEALSSLDGARGFARALEGVESESPAIRRAAVSRLGRARGAYRARAWQTLLKLAEQEPDPAVLNGVAYGIYRLARQEGMDRRKAKAALGAIARRAGAGKAHDDALRYIRELGTRRD